MKNAFGSLLFLLLIADKMTGQVNFADVSSQTGVNQIGLNYGVAIGDFNNDGLDDIFATRMLEPGALYQNIGGVTGTGGSFDNITEQAGITTSPTAQFAVWGDVDNDGWLDLFIGARDEGNALYRNNHDGTFTDIAAIAGISTGSKVKAALFADVDMDGWLDLYIARLGMENILYRNNGPNTNGVSFTDITVQSGATDPMISMGAVFFDYDNDGDPDLYLTHDANIPNILYRNNGNLTGMGVTFSDVSSITGTNIAAMGMGVDVGDLNNDGWLDLYITNLGPNALLLNNGNPTGNGNYFYNIAEQAGVADFGMGWGCSFFDYDNDGWQDIYLANDSYFSPFPNLLYRNNGNPSPAGNTFTIVSENTPLHSMEGGYGFGCFDANGDGLLDIYLANYGGNVGNQLFQNNTQNDNKWLKVKTVGVESNAAGIGARVQLKVGDRLLLDEVSGGSGWASQNSLVLHFGLGQADSIDLLTVRWPSGIIDSFENVAANQLLKVTEGETKIVDPGPSEATYKTNQNFNFEVVPNPFDDSFFINMDAKNELVNFLKIRVLDNVGRLVLSQDYSDSKSGIHLNMAGFPAGLYHVQLLTDKGLLTHKAFKTGRKP